MHPHGSDSQYLTQIQRGPLNHDFSWISVSQRRRAGPVHDLSRREAAEARDRCWHFRCWLPWVQV